MMIDRLIVGRFFVILHNDSNFLQIQDENDDKKNKVVVSKSTNIERYRYEQ
jgi:hypothetical protein